VYAAHLVAIAPGAGIGPARPFDLGTKASHESEAEVRRAEGELESLARGAGVTPGAIMPMVAGRTLPARPAPRSGAAAVVAGIAGVVALALSVYGLTVVPVRWAGIALILVWTGLQAADVLIKRVAVLTAAGTGAFLAGSLLAWWGVAPAIDISLWLVILATID